MGVTDIIAIIGGIGGIQGFIELGKWWYGRKRAARTDEFKLLRETNEFLQTQQLEKEKRFAEQTQVLRSTQRELLDTTKREAETGITHTREIAALNIELARVRCEDADCPFRRPPNAQTPPKAGMTNEIYHAQKKQQ